MKLFTDLKLNFCILTASLLLLASFGASAQTYQQRMDAEFKMQQQQAQEFQKKLKEQQDEANRKAMLGQGPDTMQSLNEKIKILTEQNRRFMESAVRYSACITAVQNEALGYNPNWRNNWDVVVRTGWQVNNNMLSKSNNCQLQFKDSFK